MMKKKIITMLLAAVLVLALVVVPSTVAAAGEYTIRLADTKGNSIVSAEAGDTVTLVLSIENNPGIIGVGVSVKTPAGISLTKQPQDVSTFAKVAKVNKVFSSDIKKKPYTMWWNMALGDFNKKLVFEEGKLAELTFKIDDNIKPGDYRIELTAPADMNRTSNVDGNKEIVDDSIASLGNVSLINCTIRVQKSAPIKITQQPADGYAPEGKNASTTVKATGDGLSYTWYHKNANASSFVKASTTGATYSTKITSSSNGRYVYCVVSDAYGNSVQTNTVRVMATPVKIAEQPTNGAAPNGKAASVTVKATGDGLTYTWYHKNASASAYVKASTTGATYSTKITSSSNGRYVYCVVKDKYGNAVQTQTVRLWMGNPAALTTKLQFGYAPEGKNASTTVKATGDGLTYTWYHKNASASSFVKASTTGATYSTKITSSSNGRYVYCVITDKYGTSITTNTVRLWRGNPATLTTKLQFGYAPEGKNASTTVMATGDGLTYTWYHKNASASSFVKASTTGATYSTKITSSSNGRYVYCVVADKYGNTVTTNTVRLWRGNPATITAQPANSTVANGQAASTTIKATGDGITYTWYHKNASASAYVKASPTGATYSTQMSASTNGRTVYCVITDKYGNSVKSNVVTLKMK